MTALLALWKVVNKKLKKVLEESLINGKKQDNKKIKEKTVKGDKCEDASVAIQKFKDII